MKKYTVPAIAAVVVAAGVAGIALTSEKPLASVNGANITKEMVDEHLSTIPVQYIQNQEDVIRKGILERLVEQELVLQNAEETGSVDEDEYVNQLEKIINQFTYNFMISQKVSEEITDEALMEEYEARKADFVMPRAKARHILVKTEGEAKDVIKALEAGANFAELAKEKSVGPSAQNGGDLGNFSMADMVPAFSQAAFALEAGSFSKAPVQTQFGWHVILLEEKDMNATVAFDAVKSQLSKALAEKVVADYIAELKEDSDIEYFDVVAETEEKAMEKTEAVAQ